MRRCLRHENKMNLFEKQSNEILRILLIIFLGTIITYIVFMTGGTKGAWPQLYYIIIILAAYYWKTQGGLLVALVLGVITGPFMPLDVSQGIMQTPENWIIRMLIFMTVGFIAGYVLQKNEKIYNRMRERDLINEVAGLYLYNTSKLFPELNKMLKNDQKICMVLFDIKNLDEISMYVSYSIVKKIIHYSISIIKSKHEGNDLYWSNFNELILVLKEYDERNINQIIVKDLENILELIKIDDYSFHLIIKAGIAFTNDGKLDAIELNRRARIASRQGESFESGVYTFEHAFDEEMRLFHDIPNSFQDAINNNEFYLLYQPLISLKDNAIVGAEVLARWNRGERKPLGPGIFITISEKAGLVNKITKEVVKQLVDQINNWKMNGMEINYSINVTGSELADESFRKWVKIFLMKTILTDLI